VRRVPRPAAVWSTPYVGESTEHLVRSGDTVSEIAQSRLGTIRNVPLLLMANPDIGNRHKIAVGQRLLLPRPGYFAGPFLVDGEKADSVEVVRWSEKEREGFLGVHARGAGDAAEDVFMLLWVRGGKSLPVFVSADHDWSTAHFDGYRRGWRWRRVDLDGDGGLDLLASRGFGAGSGTCFYAYAFHRRGDGGYARHPLVEHEPHGEFIERRRLYAGRTFVVTGAEREMLADGWRIQPVQIHCRWTGSGFTRRRVKTGRASLISEAPPAPGTLK
jgi:hypothetical protein